MADTMELAHWNRLLNQLPKKQLRRLDNLLRRSLTRGVLPAQPGSSAVPEEVRAQAVGLYRQRHMKSSSKAAKKRMTYQRLRDNPNYLAIERELMGTRRASRKELTASDLDGLSLPQVCEAYRALGTKALEPALEQLALETFHGALANGRLAQEAQDDLARFVCDAARTWDLSDCASIHAADAQAAGRMRRQHFHIQDLATPEEVAARVRGSHLVSGILRRAYGKAEGAAAIERLLAGRMRRVGKVRATVDLLGVLCGNAHACDDLLMRACRRKARSVSAALGSPTFSAQVAEALLQNPIYQKQYERAVELKLRVRQNVPEVPMDAYPLARTMERHFVLHVGPTNSGKTHDALQALMAAESGAYLGPLRLLAYEQFELMNHEGCPCTLLTGEELAEVAGARHVSSTVEMANFHKPIDVAVIDEAQMVADPDRGCHWTAAILGIPAREVHVCCAPHAANVVRELVELCEDSHHTVWHDRLVPLQAERRAFRLPGSAVPGDALIVFSRRAVHAVAAQVAAAGFRPSLVYGALPHDVRHEEARRFSEGETDVVVATDAIGMGMNLPIRRIVFVEQEKYDGHALRMLRPEEVQQIAGRAGRFGRYERGYFTSTKLRRMVAELYQQDVPRITEIPVGIPPDIALVQDATLTEAILQWRQMEQPAPFVRIDVTRDLALIGEVEQRMEPERRSDPTAKRLALALATMAFDERDETLHKAWLQMVEAELAGGEAELPVPEPPSPTMRLVDLEASYRYCDLLYTYARTFEHPAHKELLGVRRAQISHAIMDQLAQAADGGRPTG